MLIIWTFLCELPEILTLVSTCSCFKPVVAYFKRNFMRVNFIGSSHIYYHKSNYLSLTTILTHREIKLRFTGSPRTVTFAVLIHVQVFSPSSFRYKIHADNLRNIVEPRNHLRISKPRRQNQMPFSILRIKNTLQPSRKPAHIRRIYTADPR